MLPLLDGGGSEALRQQCFADPHLCGKFLNEPFRTASPQTLTSQGSARTPAPRIGSRPAGRWFHSPPTTPAWNASFPWATALSDAIFSDAPIVGMAEHREREADPRRLSSLGVDYKLDFCHLYHGQVDGLLALENTACIDAD